jgi:flagellar biosynthesis/type III secretory pathway chaperone
MTMNASPTQRLAALIATKQQVLEILVRLSRKQIELIGGGDMTTLLKLLAGKQTVMTQLQTLEHELAPFRDEDPERRAWASAAERAACQTRAERCNILLAEAMQLEQRAEAAMVERRDATQAALTHMNHAHDAHAAYAAMPITAVGSLQVEG